MIKALCLLGALILAGSAWAVGPTFITTVINDHVWWEFGQRTVFYTTKPNEMTALELHPHPTHPPEIGTQAEITIYRTHDQRPGVPLEFFNILTATGFGYDRGLQNDHHVRFGMETAFGGRHIPIFFCFEVPQGQAADCPLRIYGGDNANRGVWICRAEGDCRDLIKELWEPRGVVQVIQVEPVHTLK